MATGSEMDQVAPQAGQQATAGNRNLRTGQWLPGHSGNPFGPRIVTEQMKQRIADLIAQWTADFDGNLTNIERSMLEQAAYVLVKGERARDLDIMVRATALAQRLLVSMSKKRRPRPGRPPLRERLAAEFAND